MKHINKTTSAVGEYARALVLLTLFCGLLTSVRFIATGTSELWFLAWNLILAWLPLIFAWNLYKKTDKRGLVWRGVNIVLFVAWLLFLPNAFYLFTDYIHLDLRSDTQFIFDVVMISTYAVTGMILGYTSLLLMHKRAIQRYGKMGHWLPVAALLASGFAIYLGRELRWNSWDIIFNPLGILFDVSEILINPISQSFSIITTLLFFTFLGLVYLVVWRAISLLLARHSK